MGPETGSQLLELCGSIVLGGFAAVVFPWGRDVRRAGLVLVALGLVGAIALYLGAR